MVTRWVFTDTVLSTSFTFEINPTDGPALPTNVKHPQYMNSLAPDGGVLMLEAHDEPQQITWSGKIWTQTMYDALVFWYQKRYPITLTDDLGNSFNVYIESFTPKRERKALPLFMTYTMTVLVVS